MQNTMAAGARLSLIFLAIVAFFSVARVGQQLFAPIALGIVVGTMFLPLSRRIERLGAPKMLAGLVVVMLVFLVTFIFVIGLALPVSDFIDRGPQMWRSFRLELASWKGTLGSIQEAQRQFSGLFHDRHVSSVQVQNDNGVQSALMLGPVIVKEYLLFVVSVFFFIANAAKLWHGIRGLPIERPVKAMLMRFLDDFETSISKYLITIAAINFALGLVTWAAMAVVGLSNAYEWGLLAVILNFIPFLGPAIMTLMLVFAGLSSFHGLVPILMPAIVYLLLHMIESQVVTSQALGAATRLNPFLVFVSFAFWIWLWGPAGGFIAIPALLTGSSLYRGAKRYGRYKEQPVLASLEAEPHSTVAGLDRPVISLPARPS
ncbi:hypothetical protein ATY81_15850 [Rhizobium sp. R72]|uniref:AI-2E family transporter n=1 Tax=unclassified Rhizobium TaxID=2613769 RepID=UPI000B52F2EE|nr:MULTISPECIES: AI-2E family transporter [unclassified Rhizobium]OWV92647.1 hypothetical protein ATY81_15850 [Rhizobium sp. R72]OWV92858.1 hypothetical protein ATY80_15850 [Rhizobium sp. R711]